MKRSLLCNQYESVELKVRILLFVADILGIFFFFPLKILKRSYRRYDRKKIENILILRLDGLGDLVLSTAALREIRSGFPKAKITLVVGPWVKEVAECIPFYDHLIIHASFFFSFFRGNRKIDLRSELKFIKELRKTRFDLGIDLRGDLLSIIPLFLSGAKFRFAKNTRGGEFLLTHIVKWDRRTVKHERDKALRVGEELGISIKNRDMELCIPQKDMEYVQEYLAEKEIGQSNLIVTIAPLALYSWRSWRLERFAQVASAVVKKYNGKVVLVGSLNDRRVLDQLNALTDLKTINSAGELTLNQVAALIRKSSIFIGNDSGLIHIAAAVETPMIQLFGPGEPEKFGYRSDKNILLMKTDCPYHPCAQQVCKYQERWCMDQISVEDVMKALRKIINLPIRR